jgi:hypothetical protein
VGDTRGDQQLSKLQDVYPELLGAAYLINTPWLVSTLMKLLYAVMTKQTMAKVRAYCTAHAHAHAHAHAPPHTHTHRGRKRGVYVERDFDGDAHFLSTDGGRIYEY